MDNSKVARFLAHPVVKLHVYVPTRVRKYKRNVLQVIYYTCISLLDY